MFANVIEKNNETYRVVSEVLSETALGDLLLQNPYNAYVVMNESLEEGEDPLLTTFLVLYHSKFENNVILYDISRQKHTTITTELYFLKQGYHEQINVGRVDRYPIQLYIRENKK
ncbi:hypothetical protein JOC78_003465 [Bacillus ectoiniformans]|uniref:hypothetical protein n=1 Tax=Bacillus ectoiniformans TaxID=1494429 RepID=UPI001957155D|nr:hypothetical protein [Bacillus ectoiniformans]MBM7650473.1 hypothetical protein [Bacillus ectoiniformans]